MKSYRHIDLIWQATLIRVLSDDQNDDIDVGDKCWRRKLLVTTLICCWWLWPHRSPTSNIFLQQRRAPTFKRYHQDRNSITKIDKSSLTLSHQHHCNRRKLTLIFIVTVMITEWSPKSIPYESYGICKNVTLESEVMLCSILLFFSQKDYGHRYSWKNKTDVRRLSGSAQHSKVEYWVEIKNGYHSSRSRISYQNHSLIFLMVGIYRLACHKLLRIP